MYEKNINNEDLQQIYYRPTKTCYMVKREDKKGFETSTNTYRKEQQRKGACCIPKNKFYLCDTCCESCSYHRTPAGTPQMLSIDMEMDVSLENGISPNSFLYDKSLTTEINFDSVLLTIIFEDLKKSNTKGYLILKCEYLGLSEREAAKCLNMSRHSYRKERELLYAEIRETHKDVKS